MSTATPQAVTKYPPGTFCWIEVQTSDAEAGKRFYGELFGWSHRDTPMGDGNAYTTFTLYGEPVAGLYTGNVGQFPPHWGSSIAVGNVEQTTAQVEAAGGNVLMQPTDVTGIGRIAVIRDPTGGIVSLWEAREMIGAIYVNIPNTLIWNELMTRDPATAAAFYNKVLGWTSQVDTSGPMSYTMFMNGDRAAGGALAITPEMGDIPTYWAVYFSVEDIHASVAKAKALGATVIREPFDAGAGSIAVLDDPQGAGFNLIQTAYADPPPQG